MRSVRTIAGLVRAHSPRSCRKRLIAVRCPLSAVRCPLSAACCQHFSVLAGPHPRSHTRSARRPLACPPVFDGRPRVSPRGHASARIRAPRDGLWPVRPSSTGGLGSLRGATPPLAYALRATAFGLSARLRRAAQGLSAGPRLRSHTRSARRPLACPPVFDGRRCPLSTDIREVSAHFQCTCRTGPLGMPAE
jgi:hypothetical protein